jgi:hypothetical protein
MKPKIPALKIKSDECFISVGQVIEDGEIVDEGTPYYIHKNEWVEVLPVITVREVMQINKLQTSSTDPTGLGENLSQLCQELSQRVISWNWTNMMGEKMEQPYKRPDILEGLASEELMWLEEGRERLRLVGEHILGDGIQPNYVSVGIICESFHCLPSQVLNEDWETIRSILDYRLLISARDQHNQDASQMQPQQIQIWKEMVEAVEENG